MLYLGIETDLCAKLQKYLPIYCGLDTSKMEKFQTFNSIILIFTEYGEY